MSGQAGGRLVEDDGQGEAPKRSSKLLTGEARGSGAGAPLCWVSGPLWPAGPWEPAPVALPCPLPPGRASTAHVLTSRPGTDTAAVCPWILGNEFCERLAFYG